jgi:hypothetical protein
VIPIRRIMEAMMMNHRALSTDSGTVENGLYMVTSPESDVEERE